MNIIIGAGPAGLSCGMHMKELGIPFQIFEKESRVGGLLRTERFGNYSFDYGGHLLHFRSADMEDLVKNLIGENNLVHIKRRAFIFYNQVMTPYPFQVNTFGLPREVVRDCLLGFFDVKLKSSHIKIENFRDWILYHFGAGFAHHFFFPFNEKFWKIPLAELDSEWAEWSIPKTTIKDVVDGALGLNVQDFGYNVYFYYPKEGGVETLAKSLARGLEKIILNRAIIALNLKDRKILLDNGEDMEYNNLVSTMPLKDLLLRIKDCPEEIKIAGEGLRYLSVLCVNLGIKGPSITPSHWIYFPEDRFIFYRAGFYSNFLDRTSESQSVVLELTYLPEQEPLNEKDYIKRAIEDFRKSGLLKDEHKIEYSGTMKIPCGYVIYDKHRKNVLPSILRFLEDNGIYSIGRYGRWGYSTIEDSLRDGRETAKKLLK